MAGPLPADDESDKHRRARRLQSHSFFFTGLVLGIAIGFGLATGSWLENLGRFVFYGAIAFVLLVWLAPMLWRKFRKIF